MTLREYDIENTDQKTAVHAAIEKLAGAALIEYEWERFNRGNVLALVWLNLEKIDIAYTYLGLPQKTRHDPVGHCSHGSDSGGMGNMRGCG